MPIGAVDDSTLLVIERFFGTFVEARGAVVRDSTRLLLYRPFSREVEPLGKVPRADIIVGPDAMMRTVGMPFGPSLQTAVHPSGNAVYWGFSEAFRIHRWRAGEEPSVFIDLAISGKRVDPARVRERLADMGSLARIAQGAEPQTFPYFDKLLVAADGELWVREFLAEEDAQTR